MQKKKEGKGEEKKDNNKGKEKVEEVNAVTYKDDGEVLFTSSLPANVLVAADQNCGQEWILDSGASFHVTPHRSWFSTYDSSRRGSVHLGNDYVCLHTWCRRCAVYLSKWLYFPTEECSSCAEAH